MHRHPHRGSLGTSVPSFPAAATNLLSLHVHERFAFRACEIQSQISTYIYVYLVQPGVSFSGNMDSLASNI